MTHPAEEWTKLKRNKGIALRDQQTRKATAARAMLAALVSVQDDYRELLRSGPTDDEATEIDAMLQTVDSAIAQARAAGIEPKE